MDNKLWVTHITDTQQKRTYRLKTIFSFMDKLQTNSSDEKNTQGKDIL